MLMITIIFVVFGTIVSAVIGLFVLSRNPRRFINQVYAIMTLAFMVIVIANSMTIGDSEHALALIRIVIAGTSVAIAAIYFLATLIRDNNARLRHNRTYQFAAFSTLAVVLLDLSPVVFSGSTLQSSQVIPTPGPGFIIFATHFLVFLVGSIFILVTGIPNERGLKRSQYLSIVIGLVPILLFAPITSFVLPVLLLHTEFIFLMPLYATFFVGTVAYTVVRHGLYDVKRAAIFIFNYILTLLTLGIIYYGIAFLISKSILHNSGQGAYSIVSSAHIAIALLLAFIFQPIKHFFDRITNKLFYKNSYNIEDFFARLTKRLSVITSLDVLLRYSSSEISHTLKASFGAFYIHQIDKSAVFVATEKIKKLPTQDAEMLDTYVINNFKDIIITDDLTIEASQSIKRMLDSHHIALVLPMTKDNIIVGYLFLGDRLNSRYTHRDIQALLMIADELTITIQNALSVQEIRSLNESLQHRVDVATKELRSSNIMLMRLDKTKDDFISMASHQLRTPLTSIKGYISMVREGDAGKITKSQDQLLEEAFKSSERMVHLINDFLNLSRMQTGKFQIDRRPVDLSKVILQEIASLVTTADSHKLSFAYKAPKNFPILDLDEDKIRQVIMNFSDNAIDYSPEGTNIKVKLTLEAKYAVFTITDTGIGVPRAEQSQLFSKFYRASNARKQRPDGTGVGLYLAKTVIEAHGGKVIFESTENKGSTFGFKLPIDKLRTRSDADNFDDKNNNR